MGNISNLRPIQLTHDEATKNGRLGGKISGEKRRKRKELRQLTTNLMLSDAIPAYRDIVRNLCPGLSDNSNLAVIVARLFDVVMVGKGADSIEAARLLMEWAGFTQGYTTQQAAVEVTSEGIQDRDSEQNVIFYDLKLEGKNEKE